MCFNPKFSWGHNLSFFALGPSMVLMIEWLVLLLDGIKCMYIAVDQLSTIWVIIRYSKVVNSRHCFVSIQPQCLVTEETYLPSSAHSHKDNLCIQPVSYVVYNYWYNIWWYICRGGCPCNYSKCCFIPLKRFMYPHASMAYLLLLFVTLVNLLSRRCHFMISVGTRSYRSLSRENLNEYTSRPR